MKTTIGKWEVRSLKDSITCKHSLTGVRIHFIGRSTHCDIYVSHEDAENHFNWDPFIESLTPDAWWTEKGQVLDQQLLAYLRQLMAEPDLKNMVNTMAVETIEHFKALERLKVNSKGILTLRYKEFGSGGGCQFNFKTMQFRPKCRGPWYPLEMRRYRDKDYFYTETYEEDLSGKIWVHALGLNCSCYNKVVTKIFKDWCVRTERAKPTACSTTRPDGVRLVKLDYEYPTKGERPDHLRLVK